MPSANPLDRHGALLNSVFGFKEGVPLKRFIQDATNSSEEHFTLREILETLKAIITREKLYDETNPSIIICSEALERVFDQKALHVTQVRESVMNQLYPRDHQVALLNATNQHPTGSDVALNAISPDTAQRSHEETIQYELKPALRRVFEKVETFNRSKTTFSYSEIATALSTYIIKYKDKLIDPRNIYVIFAAADPLGEAFQVKTFHRSQVQALLRKALMPIHPTHPTRNSTDPETSASTVYDNSEAELITFQNMTIDDVTETMDNVEDQ